MGAYAGGGGLGSFIKQQLGGHSEATVSMLYAHV